MEMPERQKNGYPVAPNSGSISQAFINGEDAQRHKEEKDVVHLHPRVTEYLTCLRPFEYKMGDASIYDASFSNIGD